MQAHIHEIQLHTNGRKEKKTRKGKPREATMGNKQPVKVRKKEKKAQLCLGYSNTAAPPPPSLPPSLLFIASTLKAAAPPRPGPLV
jgi:hypothetical protein